MNAAPAIPAPLPSDTVHGSSSPPQPVPAEGPPPHPHGMFHHFWRWAQAMLQCFQLRSQLMLIEAKEAGSHYAVIAGLFAGALVIALLGYFFLVLTAVFGIAALMDGPHAWLIVLGGATAFHIILAVVLALMAKSRLKAGVFEKTKEEFHKDKLWRHTPHHTAPSKT